MTSTIIGIGSSLPAKVVTNVDLEMVLDTSDEWITQRTGIKSRHVATTEETTSTFASIAATKAIADANVSAQNVDLIIVGTVTPDYTFPSVATLVQRDINAHNAVAFDVSAACSGFVYALDIADSYVRLGKAKTALVIGAETFSKIIDWKDRSTCVLFGDGAGAVVIQQSSDAAKGIIASKIFSDGRYANSLITSGGVSTTQASGIVKMNGREVFKLAAQKMKSAIDGVLNEANCSITDIDLIIPHQANVRIIEMLADLLKIEKNKVVITLDKHANTSAASIPLALSSSKNLLDGKSVILVSMGAGFTWGATLIKM